MKIHFRSYIYCFADIFSIEGDNNEESGSRVRIIPPPGLSFYGRYPPLNVDPHDQMQGINQYNFVKFRNTTNEDMIPILFQCIHKHQH